MSKQSTSTYTRDSPECIEAFKAYKDGSITYSDYKSVQRRVYKRKKKEIDEYGHILPEWQVQYTTLPNFRKLCKRDVPESVYAYHKERYDRHNQRVVEQKKRKTYREKRKSAKWNHKYMQFIYNNFHTNNSVRCVRISQGWFDLTISWECYLSMYASHNIPYKEAGYTYCNDDPDRDTQYPTNREKWNAYTHHRGTPAREYNNKVLENIRKGIDAINKKLREQELTEEEMSSLRRQNQRLEQMMFTVVSTINSTINTFKETF